MQDRWWEREDEEKEGRGGYWFFREHYFLMLKHRLTSHVSLHDEAERVTPHFLDALPDLHQPHRAVWQLPVPVWCLEWLNGKQRQLWDYGNLCKACFIPQLTVCGSCVRQQAWWITSRTEIKSLYVLYPLNDKNLIHIWWFACFCLTINTT